MPIVDPFDRPKPDAEGITWDATPKFDPAEFAKFKAAAQQQQAKPAIVDPFDAEGIKWDATPQFDPAEFAKFKSRNASPSWSDVASQAVQNAPHSAYQFGRDIVQPVLHPIDTATNLKDLGLGLLDKAGLTNTGHAQNADAVGQFFVNRYGSIDAVKRSLATDPVGVLGDLSMFLTGGETALARAPGLVGKVGEVAGAAGRAIDPLTNAARAVRQTGNAVAEFTGLTTGVGGAPIRIAQQAGYEGGDAAKAFRDNITGREPAANVVTDARNAVNQMRQERGRIYNDEMRATGAIGADTTVLDFDKIFQGVADANEVQTYRGRSGMSEAQTLDPAAEGVRADMTKAINDWYHLDPEEFHTPEGIDALKRKLGNMRNATPPGTPERVAANNIYDAVRQTIIDQVPEYARVMEGYADASDQIKEIEKTLSLNPKASVDSALRKLQSTLRDGVNTNYGQRAALADYLTHAGAPQLMEKLAGQALNAWAPRGLARLLPAASLEFSPALAKAAAVLPMTSPRVVGNVAYATGAARRYGQPLTYLPRTLRQIGRLNAIEQGHARGGSVGNPYAHLPHFDDGGEAPGGGGGDVGAGLGDVAGGGDVGSFAGVGDVGGLPGDVGGGLAGGLAAGPAASGQGGENAATGEVAAGNTAAANAAYAGATPGAGGIFGGLGYEPMGWGSGAYDTSSPGPMGAWGDSQTGLTTVGFSPSNVGFATGTIGPGNVEGVPGTNSNVGAGSALASAIAAVNAGALNPYSGGFPAVPGTTSQEVADNLSDIAFDSPNTAIPGVNSDPTVGTASPTVANGTSNVTGYESEFGNYPATSPTPGAIAATDPATGGVTQGEYGAALAALAAALNAQSQTGYNSEFGNYPGTSPNPNSTGTAIAGSPNVSGVGTGAPGVAGGSNGTAAPSGHSNVSIADAVTSIDEPGQPVPDVSGFTNSGLIGGLSAITGLSPSDVTAVVDGQGAGPGGPELYANLAHIFAQMVTSNQAQAYNPSTQGYARGGRAVAHARDNARRYARPLTYLPPRMMRQTGRLNAAENP